MTKPHYTYGIFYPGDFSDRTKAGTMFYAGKGSGKRINSTIRSFKSQRQNGHKANILKKIRMENKEPIAQKLAEFDSEQDAYMHEVAIIFLMPQLCNLTMGGKGGMLNPAPETRIRLSNIRRGRPSPMRDKKHSDTAKKNMSIAHEGIKQSDEWVRKRVESYGDRRGRKQSDEHIEKRIAPLRGRKGPERPNQRQSAKGYSYHKNSGKWHAKIVIQGKVKSLGYFATEQEAHKAYVTALSEVLHA